MQDQAKAEETAAKAKAEEIAAKAKAEEETKNEEKTSDEK